MSKPRLSKEDLDYLMGEALLEANKAAALGEVPVGAVVSEGRNIIARAHNETESSKDPTKHAEIIALKQASDVIQNWRLTEHILCVTLEPCTMCLGASKLARIPTIVFGASDEHFGAVGSLYDLSLDKRSGPVPRVIRGVREEECVNLLQDFFNNLRKKN